ncbi:MAG: hypothetical protein ACYDAG_18815, partial [Chloroflexota bacterium]
AAAAAVGRARGPVHAELRVHDRGPWMVELAGRSIGGLCSSILEFGAGVTLEELILRQAAGLDAAPAPGSSIEAAATNTGDAAGANTGEAAAPSMGEAATTAGAASAPRAAGVMMIPIPAAGRLMAVSGVEEARSLPGIEGVTISARPNTTLVPLPEGASYLGFIFARGDSPAAVEGALRQAHARLHFEIQPAIPILPSPPPVLPEPAARHSLPVGRNRRDNSESAHQEPG